MAQAALNIQKVTTKLAVASWMDMSASPWFCLNLKQIFENSYLQMEVCSELYTSHPTGTRIFAMWYLNISIWQKFITRLLIYCSETVFQFCFQEIATSIEQWNDLTLRPRGIGLSVTSFPELLFQIIIYQIYQLTVYELGPHIRSLLFSTFPYKNNNKVT